MDDLIIVFLGIQPTEILYQFFQGHFENIHSNLFTMALKLGATQILTTRRMARDIVACLHSYTEVGNEQNTTACNEWYEYISHAWLKNPNTKENILCHFIYIQFKISKLIYAVRSDAGDCFWKINNRQEAQERHVWCWEFISYSGYWLHSSVQLVKKFLKLDTWDGYTLWYFSKKEKYFTHHFELCLVNACHTAGHERTVFVWLAIVSSASSTEPGP